MEWVLRNALRRIGGEIQNMNQKFIFHSQIKSFANTIILIYFHFYFERPLAHLINLID